MNIKMSKIRKCVFCVVVVFVFWVFTTLLRDKSIENLCMIPKSYEKKCDVIFVGSSTIMNDIYPLELYHDFGIAAYNLGCGSQSMASSYFLIKQMIRKGNIKLVVLDTFFVFLEDSYLSNEHLHYVTDKMSYPEKIECVSEIVPLKDRLQFINELDIYHERWQSLEENDFEHHTENARKIAYGAKVHYYSAPIETMGIITEEAQKMPQTSEKYLKKIISLCKENNVELLLTLMPVKYTGVFNGHDREISQKYWNYVGLLSEEYGLDFLNFMYHYQELGLDLINDSDGESHLNAYGALKCTHFVGEYIKKRYDLPDVREDNSYLFMENDYNEYVKFRENLRNIEEGR